MGTAVSILLQPSLAHRLTASKLIGAPLGPPHQRASFLLQMFDTRTTPKPISTMRLEGAAAAAATAAATVRGTDGASDVSARSGTAPVAGAEEGAKRSDGESEELRTPYEPGRRRPRWDSEVGAFRQRPWSELEEDSFSSDTSSLPSPPLSSCSLLPPSSRPPSLVILPTPSMSSSVPSTPRTPLSSSSHPYYCPTCMCHFADALVSSCCGNYTCYECAVKYLRSKRAIGSGEEGVPVEVPGWVR